MDNLSLMLILACILGLIVFCSFRYLRRKKRRTEELTRNAGRLGFRFEGDFDASPKDRFAPLRLFSLGVQGKMENVVTGTNPSTWIFDYEYSIPRDQDVGQTVGLIEMHKARWAPTVIEAKKKERFTVEAMRLLTKKLANWQLSYKEVDFTNHPEFAENYRAFCEKDPEILKSRLTGPTLEWLVQNPGWNVETVNQWLLIYRHGQYLKPKEFAAFVKSVLAIHKLIEED